MLARLFSGVFIGAAYASATLAAIPLTSNVSVSGGVAANSVFLTASVAAVGSTATATGTVLASGVDLARFNTATGILVGARIGVSGVNTATNAQLSGTVRANGGGRSIDVVTSLGGVVSGIGFTSITNAPTASNRSCNGGNCANNAKAVTTTPGPVLSGTAGVAVANLAAYAGPGTVTLARSGTGSSKVTTGAGATAGTAGAFYSFTGGTYNIAYDYLNFASPSFSSNSVITSLALDFGRTAIEKGPATLSFALFNIGNINSAGVSLKGITRDFNTSEFTTTVTNFTDLAGGKSATFTVAFDPSRIGARFDRLRMAFADHAPSGVGGRDYELDLKVSGFAVVPEPQTWAMMIVGFGLIGINARRRRSAISVPA